MGYFLFIYNALIGVFSIFKRVLFSLLIGTLLIARMDYVVLMRGFEFLDSGNAAAQQLFRCPIVTKKMSHVKAEMHQIHFRLGLHLGRRWGSIRYLRRSSRSPSRLGRAWPSPFLTHRRLRPLGLDAFGVEISSSRLCLSSNSTPAYNRLLAVFRVFD